MPSSFSNGLRTAIAQSLITRVGSGCILKSYSGTVPAGVSAVTGANTLLCTHTSSGVLGVASAAGVDVTEASLSNTAASNIGGTATFVDLCTSAGVVEDRIKVPGDGWTFSGAVVTGQAVTPAAMTIPVGNA